MKTVKVLLDYDCGRYLITPLVEQDLSKYGPEHYIYAIPESQFKEWEKFNAQDREWHKYWKDLMNKNVLDRSKCEHEYLPEEDGTVYHCGYEENLTYVDGYFYCERHL